MREYSRLGNLALWYEHIDSDKVLATISPALRARAEELLAKARGRDRMQVLDKMTEVVDNQHRIIEIKPLVVRATHTPKGRPIAEFMGDFLDAYLASLPLDRRLLLSRYRVVDVARKVVGVGSVGTRCWMIFMQGESGADPLFLQVKEAQTSVLASFFPGDPLVANHGLRVVAGQRLLQGSPDIFLGWGELHDVHFYVRQLRDMKGGIEFVPGKSRPDGVHQSIAASADGRWRSLTRNRETPRPSRATIGKSDELADALVRFAEGYADQTERDHAAMAKAAKEGKLQVAVGE